jgi:lipopolysaccharide/colanic/teichoic acid biosynthesis glycosyltransferase
MSSAISSHGGLVFNRVLVKRVIDILIAGPLLAASFPLFLISAIIIKLDSRGPVLFRQTRIGKRFKPFSLLKLRTMDATCQGLPYTVGDDPRITRPGRWLRWFKFDEFPQLWNVLRGDMSLVGPRPVVPELTEEFRLDYADLLQVRPGLTDPATLKYCRETELLSHVPNPLAYFKTVVTPDKLRISRNYLHRSTIWTDLVVLFATAFALFRYRPRPIPSQSGRIAFESAKPGASHSGINLIHAQAQQILPLAMHGPVATIHVAAGATHVTTVFARSSVCRECRPRGRGLAGRVRRCRLMRHHSTERSRS